MDRCYRISQTKDVTVYRLIASGTVEEKMYEKQVHKDGIRRAVMTNQGNATERFFDKKDLRKLFELAPAGECVMLAKFNDDIRGSSGLPTFLSAHDGVVGVSSHDEVYKRTIINLDDESGAHTPFSGTPARSTKVVGRSQRALSTKSFLNIAEVPQENEKENTPANGFAQPSSLQKKLPQKLEEITNKTLSSAVDESEKQSLPLATKESTPDVQLYDSMDLALISLAEQKLRGDEKLALLQQIALLGRELDWLHD